MNIMLCGSSDIEPYFDPFKDTVFSFEANPFCFIDSSIKYSNYSDWAKNSEETVKISDVLVFLILERYGKITWQTEFKISKEIGKPFIILCLDSTYQTYVSLNQGLKESNLVEDNIKETLQLLINLEGEKRSIVTITEQNFANILKKQLSKVFTEGTEILQQENKKKILIEIVKMRGKEAIKDLAKKENKDYLKQMLRDIFQPKEVRKRILECFCKNEFLKLSQQEILDLVYDPEQGVQRRTVQLLPELVHSEIDKNFVFDFLLNYTDEVDDSGFDRRLILSLLEIDAILATKKLKSFKMTDIGVPKRITSWIDEHKEYLKTQIDNLEFKEDLKTLVELCQNYEKGSNSLKATAERINTWLN